MARTGTVIPEGLNLRATPGGTIIKVLTQGTVVEVLEDQGTFLKVDDGADVGFVKASFIHKNYFHFDGNNAVAPDGTVFGKKFQQGIYNYGTTSIAAFVEANPDAFPNLSASRLRVMSAVSTNEGKLEAINTYDNSFLTFGCFQWTVGAGTGAGELPGMVNQLKLADADVFAELFGQFGLDIASVTSPPGQTPTGFFSLNGQAIKTATEKQANLRTLEMAYRFWIGGHNDTMRQVEIEYAASRIDLFYRESNHKINTRFVADYVSSEFGVALLLDEHVNRPGNVPATLKWAVNKFINTTGKNDPVTWTTQDEAEVLDLYIERRSTTSMTDSTLRADKIREAVNDGLASDERGSFQP